MIASGFRRLCNIFLLCSLWVHGWVETRVSGVVDARNQFCPASAWWITGGNSSVIDGSQCFEVGYFFVGCEDTGRALPVINGVWAEETTLTHFEGIKMSIFGGQSKHVFAYSTTIITAGPIIGWFSANMPRERRLNMHWCIVSLVRHWDCEETDSIILWL